MSYWQLTINIKHECFNKYIDLLENYIDVSGHDYIHATEIGKEKKHEHIHSYIYVETAKRKNALLRQLRRDFIDEGYATTNGNVLQCKKHNSQKLGYFTKEYRELYYKQRTNIKQDTIDTTNKNWIEWQLDTSKINKDDRKALEKYLLNVYANDIDNRPKRKRQHLIYMVELLRETLTEYKKKKSTGMNPYREDDFLRMIFCKISNDYTIGYNKSRSQKLIEEITDFIDFTPKPKKKQAPLNEDYYQDYALDEV
jgi:hypothetical protein